MNAAGRRAAVAAAAGLLTTGLSVAATSGPAEAAPCQVGKTAYVKDQNASNALASIGVPQSWRLATGRGVTVAVVDSGVDAANQHLGRAVLPGRTFVGGTGRTDINGHGTAVAGIIAAREYKQSALVGVAYDARILPVRVYVDERTPTNPSPSTKYLPDTSRLADGIRWAADNGADVINVSISTSATDDALAKLRSAVRYAVQEKDVVVVASGGDQAAGKEDVSLVVPRFPAGFPGVIGVTATNAEGVVDNASIHGEHIDVSAPGANVLLAFYRNGDCLSDGVAASSWATAFVSGVAAQLRERYPEESAAEIGYRIKASAARPRPGERDILQGWGLVQPYAALSMTIDPNRPGPRVPGETAPKVEVEPSGATVAAPAEDVLTAARSSVLWWSILGIGLCALMLVLRPWVGRLVRRTRSTP